MMNLFFNIVGVIAMVEGGFSLFSLSFIYFFFKFQSNFAFWLFAFWIVETGDVFLHLVAVIYCKCD